MRHEQKFAGGFWENSEPFQASLRGAEQKARRAWAPKASPSCLPVDLSLCERNKCVFVPATVSVYFPASQSITSWYRSLTVHMAALVIGYLWSFMRRGWKIHCCSLCSSSVPLMPSHELSMAHPNLPTLYNSRRICKSLYGMTNSCTQEVSTQQLPSGNAPRGLTGKPHLRAPPGGPTVATVRGGTVLCLRNTPLWLLTP